MRLLYSTRLLFLTVTFAVQLTAFSVNVQAKSPESFDYRSSGDSPIRLDDITATTKSGVLASLRSIAKEIRNYPDFFMYLIMYKAPRESERSVRQREAFIKTHLTKTHKISGSRLIFVYGGFLDRSTKVYLIPPRKNDQALLEKND